MHSNSALLCLTADHVYSSGGFLSFVHQFWLLVQHDDFRMEMSLLGEIFLIFHKNFLEHRLVQEVPVLRSMFSEPDFTKNNLSVPSAAGNKKLSPHFGRITSFAMSLRAWISGAPKFSSSSRSATAMCLLCRFPPRTMHIPRIFWAKLGSRLLVKS